MILSFNDLIKDPHNSRLESSCYEGEWWSDTPNIIE